MKYLLRIILLTISFFQIGLMPLEACQPEEFSANAGLDKSDINKVLIILKNGNVINAPNLLYDEYHGASHHYIATLEFANKVSKISNFRLSFCT